MIGVADFRDRDIMVMMPSVFHRTQYFAFVPRGQGITHLQIQL
jgi:hypothetical protein